MSNLDELRKQNQQEAEQGGFKCLVYGDFGTGKTRFLTTARRPILIDFFDPEGWEQPRIREGRKEGWIIADTRWAVEEPEHGSVWSNWETERSKRLASGVFNEVGTYCVDSLSTFWFARMNHQLKMKKRAMGSQPYQDDYGPVGFQLRNVIQSLAALPCDFILTAHTELIQDELTGKVETTLRIQKMLKRLPEFFGEYYAMDTSEDSKGVHYRLITQSTGRFKARTCMGGEGLFQTYEEPNVKLLMEKAGMKWERADDEK